MQEDVQGLRGLLAIKEVRFRREETRPASSAGRGLLCQWRRAACRAASAVALRSLCRDRDAGRGFRGSGCGCFSLAWAPRLPGGSLQRPSLLLRDPRPAATMSRQPERPAMEASTASPRPIKGILKNKTSAASPPVVPSAEQSRPIVEEELSKKSQKWDEMNILTTYHPADKDYGLMKIDEPNTPYHNMIGDDEDAYSDSEGNEVMTPDILAKKLAAAEGSEPKYRTREQENSGEEDNDLSPEEREKKRQFEMKRKLHYNEGLNIKLARQLISKDLHDDDEDEEMAETADGESMNVEESSQGSTTSDHLQHKSQSS
uniref:Protein phosphatase 1, regulatory (inhibitor) subunit 2, pseudogene 5 n=1 Tax=Mus musculus TaxID=10090 RepID=A0ABA7IW32_MOUSE